MTASVTPTRAEILAAAGRTVPDVIARDLAVLFCGINPSLYSAAVGHHFARPGNRFWKTIHEAGFTPRLFSPYEDATLLEHGIGITNLVARATAQAAELSRDELQAGKATLVEKLERYRPGVLAVLGIGAYRDAFGLRGAQPGPQPDEVHGARVWILPNPSGLNAHYQLAELAGAYRELRQVVSISR